MIDDIFVFDHLHDMSNENLDPARQDSIQMCDMQVGMGARYSERQREELGAVSVKFYNAHIDAPEAARVDDARDRGSTRSCPGRGARATRR